MDIASHIDAVEELSRSLRDFSRMNRLHTYAAIQVLLGELLSYTEKTPEFIAIIPRVRPCISEMLNHLRAIAGLDRNVQNEEEGCRKLMEGIDRLRSVHCFNVAGLSEDDDDYVLTD